MNKVLSAIGVTISIIALGASAWTLNRLFQLQSSIEQQQNTVEQQQDEIVRQQNAIEQQQAQLEELARQQPTTVTTTQNNSSADNTTNVSTSIQPGQFVRQGVDNKIKIELLSVKRIDNPDGGAREIVVVQMQIRRIVPKGKVDSLNLRLSKGRNPETSEVYGVIRGKNTGSLTINNIPEDAWGNAYFWLEVPEGIDVIDIIIPETAIFERVPISNN
ncbi:MAG: hypothetical protein AAGE96_12425 [Cyanobacteria bacterium P01_G01_bin.19]